VRGEQGSAPFASDRGALQRIRLDDVVDIDGDGEVEFVLGLSSSIMISDGGDGWADAITRSRMLIVRADLSLQLDTELDQGVYYLGEGMLNEESSVDAEPYTRAADGSLMFRWCVIDAEAGRSCPSAVLCPTPNNEVVLNYDAATDTYVRGKHTKLQREINLEDERCTGVSRDEEGADEESDECEHDGECE
jgi:hypothetical protein